MEAGHHRADRDILAASDLGVGQSEDLPQPQRLPENGREPEADPEGGQLQVGQGSIVRCCAAPQREGGRKLLRLPPPQGFEAAVADDRAEPGLFFAGCSGPPRPPGTQPGFLAGVLRSFGTDDRAGVAEGVAGESR